MKLSNIEYTQRAQELEILLNFYLIQIKPISMKAIGLRDVYYSVMAYLKIVLQLEKLILSFVYNGKLERNEEQDLFNLLDEIYKQGIGHFELEEVSAFLDRELAESEIQATNIVLLSELHGIAKVILDSDYTKALFQLYWVWHKNLVRCLAKKYLLISLKKEKFYFTK